MDFPKRQRANALGLAIGADLWRNEVARVVSEYGAHGTETVLSLLACMDFPGLEDSVDSGTDADYLAAVERAARLAWDRSREGYQARRRRREQTA